jgi:hypothetical protein
MTLKLENDELWTIKESTLRNLGTGVQVVAISTPCSYDSDHPTTHVVAVAIDGLLQRMVFQIDKTNR